MKKVLFLSASLFIGLFSFISNTSAQSTSDDFNKTKLMKSVSAASDADKLAIENIKAMSTRMYRDFSFRYKNATEIQVYLDGNNHRISCVTDGGFNRITYNKKGTWQHSIRTYDNEKLRADVREHIEYLYPRFSIFGGVIEVSVGGKTAYLVTIEDKKSWKRIRVVDGESDVYEEHKKS